MGKKVNPKIFRIGINRTWPSVWFATGKDYIKNNKTDVLVRRFLMNDLKEAGIDNVRIERVEKSLWIYRRKPGVIIATAATA